MLSLLVKSRCPTMALVQRAVSVVLYGDGVGKKVIIHLFNNLIISKLEFITVMCTLYHDQFIFKDLQLCTTFNDMSFPLGNNSVD